MCIALQRLCKHAPACVVANVIRAFCNSWCTSRRFRGVTLNCRLCDMASADCMLRILVCPCFSPVCRLLPSLPSSFASASASVRASLFLLLPLGLSQLISVALYIDSCYACYHEAKRWPRVSEPRERERLGKLAKARLIQLRRRAPPAT
eukprot:8119383-Pyramimonas_sp.AAC.1